MSVVAADSAPAHSLRVPSRSRRPLPPPSSHLAPLFPAATAAPRAMDSTADADLPSWSAPGDATLQSLLVGVLIGLVVALSTLVALTHSAAQWAALAARLWLHAPAISTAVTVAIASWIFVQLGCRKWKQHVAIKAEVSTQRTRVAAATRIRTGVESHVAHSTPLCVPDCRSAWLHSNETLRTCPLDFQTVRLNARNELE